MSIDAPSVAFDRADVEALTERTDELGALARIVIAVSDGESPDPRDCEQVEWESASVATELFDATSGGDD